MNERKVAALVFVIGAMMLLGTLIGLLSTAPHFHYNRAGSLVIGAIGAYLVLMGIFFRMGSE
jgi:hypothetical protein